MNFPAPPIQTPFKDDRTASGISLPWTQWFQAVSVKLGTVSPAITGSKGGNAALGSLISTLASNGEITDNTTP
jgi:hypothetical protein